MSNYTGEEIGCLDADKMISIFHVILQYQNNLKTDSLVVKNSLLIQSFVFLKPGKNKTRTVAQDT